MTDLQYMTVVRMWRHTVQQFVPIGFQLCFKFNVFLPDSISILCFYFLFQTITPDQVSNAGSIYIPPMKRTGKKMKNELEWRICEKPRNISPLHYIYQKSTSGMGKDAILDLASPGIARSGCWVKDSPGFPLWAPKMLFKHAYVYSWG